MNLTEKTLRTHERLSKKLGPLEVIVMLEYDEEQDITEMWVNILKGPKLLNSEEYEYMRDIYNDFGARGWEPVL